MLIVLFAVVPAAFSDTSTVSEVDRFAIVVGSNHPLPDSELEVLQHADDDALRFAEYFAELGVDTEVLTTPDHETAQRFHDVARIARRPTMRELDAALERARDKRRRVEGLPRMREVRTGWSFSCGISEVDALYCWGLDFGAPERMQSDVLEVSTGDRVTCTLGRGGRIECVDWFRARTPPSRDRSLVIEDAVELVSASHFDCARTSTGSVWCWGTDNSKGFFGDGSTTLRAVPVPVFHLDDATKISAMFDHTCALRRNAEIVCWGSDGEVGRLGIGATRSHPNPVTVLDVSQAIELAAGRDTSCAIDRGGRLICWGFDDFGQLSGRSAFALFPERVRFGE